MKSKTGPKPRKNVFGFFDEVGVLHSTREDRVFGLGLIKLHKPAELHRKILDYKNKVNFHDEFKFRNVRDANLKLYKGFVDLFFETRLVVFTCIMFDKLALEIDRYFKSNYHKANNAFTAKLIASSLDKSEYIAVLADDISTPKNDNYEKEVKNKVRAKTRRNALFGICRFESHAVSEIQMTDVLLGTVAYAFKIKYGLVGLNRKSAKIKLVKYLQNQLNTDLISRTGKFSLSYGRRFSVREFKGRPKK